MAASQLSQPSFVHKAAAAPAEGLFLHGSQFRRGHGLASSLQGVRSCGEPRRSYRRVVTGSRHASLRQPPSEEASQGPTVLGRRLSGLGPLVGVRSHFQAGSCRCSADVAQAETSADDDTETPFSSPDDGGDGQEDKEGGDLDADDFDSEAENGGLASKEEELSRATLIWRAAKLPLYSVAAIPLMVGAAAAYYDTGVFFAARFWTLLLAGFLVTAWLNLSNDAYDSETGVDVGKKESVVNLTGSRNLVLAWAYTSLAGGLAAITFTAWTIKDPRVAILLGLAVACGYVYQCPPFRLSYKGVGEPLCFLAYGPLATTAFYLSQLKSSLVSGASPVTPTAFGASILVGITTALILFCSHFHQIDDDLKVGKVSPLVRLGTARGAVVVKWAVVSFYVLITAMVVTRTLPVACGVTSLFTLGRAREAVSFVSENHKDKSAIFKAKYMMNRLHLATGLATVFGLLLGVWIPALLA